MKDRQRGRMSYSSAGACREIEIKYILPNLHIIIEHDIRDTIAVEVANRGVIARLVKVEWETDWWVREITQVKRLHCGAIIDDLKDVLAPVAIIVAGLIVIEIPTVRTPGVELTVPSPNVGRVVVGIGTPNIIGQSIAGEVAEGTAIDI